MDVLFLVGESRLFKRCGGVKVPCTAFMLEEARKRSRRDAAGTWSVMDAAAGRRALAVTLVGAGRGTLWLCVGVVLEAWRSDRRTSTTGNRQSCVNA